VFRLIAIGILLAALVVSVTTPVLADPDVWATGSAWLSTDPDHAGYWEYCYEVSWAGLPHGVSHVDVFLLLDECVCACSPGYFAFADTCGSGPGTPDGPLCTVYYYGLFECFGDPSIEVETPLVKFEPYENGCEPAKDGWAHVCFYSVAAPIYNMYPGVIALKFGLLWAVGDLDGPLPDCDTSYSSAGRSTWGAVKALYR
jgi:hypothetical protein